MYETSRIVVLLFECVVAFLGVPTSSMAAAL